MDPMVISDLVIRALSWIYVLDLPRGLRICFQDYSGDEDAGSMLEPASSTFP